MLGAKQRSSLFYFIDALAWLFSEQQDKSKISELREQVNVALALMERDFPVAIQVSIYSAYGATFCFQYANMEGEGMGYLITCSEIMECRKVDTRGWGVGGSAQLL